MSPRESTAATSMPHWLQTGPSCHQSCRQIKDSGLSSQELLWVQLRWGRTSQLCHQLAPLIGSLLSNLVLSEQL